MAIITWRRPRVTRARAQVENPTAGGDDTDKVQWRERELQPMLLQRVLRRLYDTFHLIYGRMAAVMGTCRHVWFVCLSC